MIPEPIRSPALALVCALSSWGASCDRVAEPEGRPLPAPAPSAPAIASSPEAPTTPVARCLVPLTEPPPPPQSAAEHCPEPPRPVPDMPRSSITFADAKGAPEVTVELARTPEHRAHGLMYRQSLADDEGMLFSWTREDPRSFWMRNTCLALDMLFLASDGTIVGILEQVPPMNEKPRTVPCKAQHVLELRAGWSRTYGVAPGQRVLFAEH